MHTHSQNRLTQCCEFLVAHIPNQSPPPHACQTETEKEVKCSQQTQMLLYITVFQVLKSASNKL